MSGAKLIERGLLINGRETAAADGETLDIVNPTNGEVFGRIALASEADIDQAVAVAELTEVLGYGDSRVRRLAELSDGTH